MFKDESHRIILHRHKSFMSVSCLSISENVSWKVSWIKFKSISKTLQVSENRFSFKCIKTLGALQNVSICLYNKFSIKRFPQIFLHKSFSFSVNVCFSYFFSHTDGSTYANSSWKLKQDSDLEHSCSLEALRKH